MNALDSPIEALAIDYLSHGWLTAVNSVWAWLAVITAAVGLWRIRGLSPPTRRRDGPAPCSLVKSATAVNAPVVTEDLVPAPLEAAYCLADSEGSPKGKFSVYFEHDLGGIDNRGCGQGRAATKREEESRLGCGDWERTMLVARLGDMGWFRWQDLNVLDGNVVRLWDSRRKRSAAVAVAGGGWRL